MEQTKQKSRTGLFVILIAVLLLAMLAFGYSLGVRYYGEHFPRNTFINGMNVTNMTAGNVKLELERQAKSYVLTISERNGAIESISAEEVSLTYQDNGEVDAILTSYNPYLWFIDFFTTDEHAVDANSLALDEAQASAAISKLSCFNPALVKKPENARLSFEGGECTIQPEELGNQLDEEKTAALIRSALTSGITALDLDAEGCYIAPEITSEDPLLQQQMEQVKPWLASEITFDFEDGRVYTVNAEVIAQWLVVDDAGVYDLDNDLVFDWVKRQLAYQTDTFGLTHTFKTSKGTTISLTGGDYGWCISRQKTTDKLIEAVKNGEVTEMEPEYLYTGKFRGINDIGNTYVEISIQDQHVWCYKNGQLVVESDCVTGCVSQGHDTPAGGVWAIDAKKSPAVLGTIETMGYSSPVTYWMPFNKNVGLHDADGWRNAYGGDIYKTNGSHGCVNLPLEAAKAIYNAVQIGTAVIVY